MLYADVTKVSYIDDQGDEHELDFTVAKKIVNKKLIKDEVPIMWTFNAFDQTWRITVKQFSFVCLMLSIFATVMILVFSLAPPSNPTKRHFYLSIDEIEWDYYPALNRSVDSCTGEELGYPANLFLDSGIGSTYTKAVFRQYTDETFTTPIERTQEWTHLGLLGPALHVEVGDLVCTISLCSLKCL